MRKRSQARSLAAVLFTDIVDSTLLGGRIGDRRWKELIARHNALVRRELRRFGGDELDTAGDGFFASFEQPAAAVRCACSIAEAVRQLGIELRAGVHFGECEHVGTKLGGLTVVVGARVMSLGGAGDVLVTGTTRELIGGASIGFEDRGRQVLKGLEGEWQVFAVTEVDGVPRPGRSNAHAAEERLAAVQPTIARRSPARSTLVGGLVVALALIAVAIPLVGTEGDSSVEIGTNSVALMDADDGSIEVATQLGQRPGASAIGFDSLWVTQPDRGVVARLALHNGSVTDTIQVGNSPAGVAVGEGAVWVTNAGDGTVSRIDVETNEVSQVLRAGASPTGIAVGDGALWVADSIGTALLRVDPTSEEVLSIPLAGRPAGVAFTADAVWVSVAPNSVARVDPEGTAVAFTQPVGGGPTSVLAAFGSIWVANHLDGTVTRLEPSTGRGEATIPVGQGPNALVAAGGSLWVANEFGDSVAVIDPSLNDVERTVPVGGAAISLAGGDDDALWLAVGTSASEHRGGTLAVSSLSLPESLDPAVAYDVTSWQILAMTNDGLLAYKKVGGPDGATLVPDLASAPPVVSSDGLIYRFPLRQGITYSTGEPVRPEDFRRAIERALVLHDARSLLSAIEGADACTPDAPAACDLSGSIESDEESVTFRLATPDPELPYKLAMPFAFPVPANTPPEDQGLRPLPATGPYLVTEAGPDGVELVRNTEFQEWSAAAQPDGYVDRISWRFGEDLSDAFTRLQAGELDVMFDALPQDLAILHSTQPNQIVAFPEAATLFVGFDVVKPPFDEERVRRAVNYAIDRDRVVELLGGSTTLRSTCQILPPNFQGYAPFCPYTLDPMSGVWSAPDLDRARALIEAAGVAGTPVTVSTTDDSSLGITPRAEETMKYITDVLEELGLEPQLEIEHDAGAYFTSIFPPAGGSTGTEAGTPRHPHVFFSAWLPDYPSASNFIDTQFACGDRGFANASGWCDKALDARVDETLLLNTTDPGAANRAWTEIEHDLVEQAAQAPLANPVTTHAISDRVENVQAHPQWGLMLNLLWVQ